MDNLPKPNPIKGKGHIFVLGITRSGKSWYSMFKLMFAPPEKYSGRPSGLHEVNIFVDTNNSTRDPDYIRELLKMNKVYHNTVAIAHNVEEFTDDFANMKIKFIIVQPGLLEEIGEFAAKVEQIIDIVRNTQATTPSSMRPTINLYLDEISALAPKWSESTVSFIFTRGAILKIYGIAISQRPALCNKTIYCEAMNTVVFKLKNEDYVGLKRFGLDVPFEVQRDIAAHKWLYYVYDGTTWTRGEHEGRGRPSKVKVER